MPLDAAGFAWSQAMDLPLPATLHLLEDSGDLIIKRANYINRLIKTLLISDTKRKTGDQPQSFEVWGRVDPGSIS